jgi:hypothetical protein
MPFRHTSAYVLTTVTLLAFLCTQLKAQRNQAGITAVLSENDQGNGRFQLWPDVEWHQPSAVEGQITLVATTDRQRSKCKPMDQAFPPMHISSPSHGWESQSGYTSRSYGSGPGVSQSIVFKAPLTGYQYCEHRVHVNTSVGTTRFFPADWTSTTITIVEEADAHLDNFPLEDNSASIGLTVYVKWVPDRSADSSCGPIPGSPNQGANIHGEPGDFWYFTPR